MAKGSKLKLPEKNKWIQFIEMESKGTKTKIYHIWTKDGQTLLGEIRWYAPWRQYTFTSMPNMIFERQCLIDIVRFIHDLMEERKFIKRLQKY